MIQTFDIINRITTNMKLQVLCEKICGVLTKLGIDYS